MLKSWVPSRNFAASLMAWMSRGLESNTARGTRRLGRAQTPIIKPGSNPAHKFHIELHFPAWNGPDHKPRGQNDLRSAGIQNPRLFPNFYPAVLPRTAPLQSLCPNSWLQHENRNAPSAADKLKKMLPGEKKKIKISNLVVVLQPLDLQQAKRWNQEGAGMG